MKKFLLLLLLPFSVSATEISEEDKINVLRMLNSNWFVSYYVADKLEDGSITTDEYNEIRAHYIDMSYANETQMWMMYNVDKQVYLEKRQ